MDDKILELLLEIEKAAENLAPQAWELLVKKQQLSGIIELIMFVIIASFVIYIAYRLNKFADNYECEGYACVNDIKYLSKAVVFIILLFGSIISWGVVENIIIKIVLPKYAAIQQLISWMK